MKYIFNAVILIIVIIVIRATICQNREEDDVIITTTCDSGANFNGARLLKKCKTGFSSPQSAVLDKERNVIYVSNIFDGDISGGYVCRAGLSGEIIDSLKIDSLSNPRGLAVRDSILYIADSCFVVEYDTKNDTAVKKNKIDGAEALNDIVISVKGTVYVSDSRKNCIFSLSENGKKVFWKEPKDSYVGSLCLADGFLYAAGENKIFKISSKASAQVFKYLKFTPSGIKPDGKGGFLVSGLGEGVFVISSNFDEQLVKKRKNIYCTDFEYIEQQNTLFLPTDTDDGLEVYEIGKYFQNKE